ncbi:MAG: hypothetical protein AB7L84_15145 [Acidimicrobiia bacterium]
MRRRGARLLGSLALTLTLATGPVTAAGAQEPGRSTTTLAPAVPAPDIIPRPNSGSEPTEAGDRGGALQLGLLGLLVAAVGGGGYALARQSRRARGTDRERVAS